MSQDGLILFLGRLLLGGLFVVGGLRHFTILDELTPVLAAKNLPWPRLGLIAISLFEIACGALLIAGIATPWVAYGLILIVIAVSLIMLDFWNQQGEMRANSISILMLNAGIVGGLLIASLHG